MLGTMQMGVSALLRSRRGKLYGLTLVAVALAADVAQAQNSGRVQSNPNLASAPSSPKQAPAQSSAQSAVNPAPAAAVNPAAAKLVVQAALLVKERKYDEAVPLLDKALAIDPKLVPALKLRLAIRLL